MAFTFPHIAEKDKEVFDFTFLNEVALKIVLPVEEEFVSFERASRLFKELFKLPFNQENYEAICKKRQKVGNSDDSVMFEFSRKEVKISIYQSKYRSFNESMMPLLESFVNEYKKWYNYCDDVQLKFVDVWPFSDIKDVTQKKIEDLENAVFTTALRSSSEKLSDNLKGLKCRDDNFEVDIKFGSYVPEDSSQNSGVALESRIELIRKHLNCQDIISKALEMNNVLYDAFRWAVTDNVINAMRFANK